MTWIGCCCDVFLYHHHFSDDGEPISIPLPYILRLLYVLFWRGVIPKSLKCLTVICARASIQILMAKELWFCSIEILIIDFWVLQIVFFFPWAIFYSVGSDLHFYCSFIFFSLIQYFLIRSTVIIGDILLPHSYQRSRSLPIVHIGAFGNNNKHSYTYYVSKRILRTKLSLFVSYSPGLVHSAEQLAEFR